MSKTALFTVMCFGECLFKRNELLLTPPLSSFLFFKFKQLDTWDCLGLCIFVGFLFLGGWGGEWIFIIARCLCPHTAKTHLYANSIQNKISLRLPLQGGTYLESKQNVGLKGIVHKNLSHYLLTLMSFQIHKTCIHLRQTNDDIFYEIKNIYVPPFHQNFDNSKVYEDIIKIIHIKRVV